MIVIIISIILYNNNKSKIIYKKNKKNNKDNNKKIIHNNETLEPNFNQSMVPRQRSVNKLKSLKVIVTFIHIVQPQSPRQVHEFLSLSLSLKLVWQSLTSFYFYWWSKRICILK